MQEHKLRRQGLLENKLDRLPNEYFSTDSNTSSRKQSEGKSPFVPVLSDFKVFLPFLDKYVVATLSTSESLVDQQDPGSSTVS